MGRFFNTAGPIVKKDHYNVEPLERIDLNGILTLIEQNKYFVLHAPRQTGKTSYLMALMDYLNKDGKYTALYTNIENAQAGRGNVKEGIRSVLNAIAVDARDYLGDMFLEERWEDSWRQEVS